MLLPMKQFGPAAQVGSSLASQVISAVKVPRGIKIIRHKNVSNARLAVVFVSLVL